MRNSLPRNLTILKTTMVLLLLAVGPTLRAAEDDLYKFLWLDPDKQVYVLQNKVYKKRNSFYGSLGYLSGNSNEFQDTSGFQLTTGFYFHEEWALELFYNSYSNSNNDAFESLQRVNGSVPFIRKVDSSYGAMAIWSPFYGKVNTFNKIFYFDWNFGLGVTKINAQTNASTVANPNTSDQFQTESYTGVAYKTGLRFHASEHIHIGIDYFRQSYQAPGPTLNNVPGSDKWRHNSDVIFSVGFSF